MQPERYIEKQFEQPLNAKNSLNLIKETLGITNIHLAKMFRTTPRSIISWKKNGIPKEKQEQVIEAVSVTNLLIEMFVPNRLQTVIRRKSDVFNGKALDQIMGGHFKLVKEKYEKALRYQG